MAVNILNSSRAVAMSVYIIRSPKPACRASYQAAASAKSASASGRMSSRQSTA
jgi:hypothetical protein